MLSNKSRRINEATKYIPRYFYTKSRMIHIIWYTISEIPSVDSQRSYCFLVDGFPVEYDIVYRTNHIIIFEINKIQVVATIRHRLTVVICDQYMLVFVPSFPMLINCTPGSEVAITLKAPSHHCDTAFDMVLATRIFNLTWPRFSRFWCKAIEVYWNYLSIDIDQIFINQNL